MGLVHMMEPSLHEQYIYMRNKKKHNTIVSWGHCGVDARIREGRVGFVWLGGGGELC